MGRFAPALYCPRQHTIPVCEPGLWLHWFSREGRYPTRNYHFRTEDCLITFNKNPPGNIPGGCVCTYLVEVSRKSTFGISLITAFLLLLHTYFGNQHPHF